MEASLYVNEIINVLQAISQQENKVKKKNIIIANKENNLLISVIKYHLGDPDPGFEPLLIYKPQFYIAEPPEFTEWEELMDYFRTHRDVEDRLITAQRFIQLKPWTDRDAWKHILSKTTVLGNEQYLATVINKEENSA